MDNPKIKIELKRGIYKVCCNGLMEKISITTGFAFFYKDIFETYEVPFDYATVRQKRSFVAAVTKYFIIDRLPSEVLYIEDGKYEHVKGCNKIFDLLEDTITTYNKIKENSESNQDFMKKYAEYYNEEVRDFSQEISENRDDSLSDFAKAVEKLYYYKEDKNSK